jgi:uncharacterized glyoxalase superfamily protein PhnB
VLEVDDLDEEYARVTAARWPLAEDLADRPWGLRDFRLLDPSGYYWRITGRGNHFAAWQEPALFAGELRAAFRSLR